MEVKKVARLAVVRMSCCSMILPLLREREKRKKKRGEGGWRGWSRSRRREEEK